MGTLVRFVTGRRRCLLGMALALAPGAALACRVPPPPSEVVFYDLPSRLPMDLTILKVSFPASGPIYEGETPRLAYVQAVVRGAYAGKSVRVLVDGAQSGGCRHAYTSSKSGYIIGRLQRDPGGKVVFLPVYETLAERQKRGGVQKPEPPATQPVVRPFRIFQPLWVRQPTSADVRHHRPRGEVPFAAAYGVFVRCGVAADGTMNNCRSEHPRDPAPAWTAAAVKVARLHRMGPRTQEGWNVDGGEVDFRITFDPPVACEAIKVCR